MSSGGTLGDGVEVVFGSRVVGVGEIVSWPEYRRARFSKPEPIRFTAVAGDVVTITLPVWAPAPVNRMARRRAARMSRRR